MVPEAHDTQTDRLQIPRACSITDHIVRMLPTIHLHHQPALHADEVDDVATHPMLATELEARLLVAQALP